MLKEWKVKLFLAGLGLIVALALFAAYPLALLVLACAAAAAWAGARAGRAGMALVVPLAAGVLGYAFALAAQGWLGLVGKGAPPIAWWSWLTLDPLSSAANRAGRIGVVVGSLAGLAAPWLAGYLSGWGEKHSPTRVHGLRVADSAAKGTSRWAGDADVAHVCEFGPPRPGKWGGGIVLGKLQGRVVRVILGGKRPDQPGIAGHAAVMGATGAGKSHSFVRPNIIAAAEEGQSIVVTDPKGELCRDMTRWLESRGYKVYIFNLADPRHSHRWNPIEECRDDEELDAFASAIIRNAAPGDKSGYFVAKEIQLLRVLIGLLKADFPPEQQHLRAVLSLCSWPVEALDARFEEAYRAGRLDQGILEDWRGAVSSNWENAVSGVTSKLRIFRAAPIAALLSQQELNLSAVGREKAALFCILPIGAGHLKPVLAAFYYFFFRRLYMFAEECGGTLPVPVRFVLDEFANIGEIPKFVETISTARSMGILIQFVLQNLTQLEENYGAKESQAILANCGTRLLLAVNDLATAKYFSSLLGEAAVETISERQDVTVPMKHWFELPRRTRTIVRRPLMEPEELMRLDPESAPKTAIAVVQWCLPMYLEKLDWKELPQAREVKAAGQVPVRELVPERDMRVALPPIPEGEPEPPERERRRTRAAEPVSNMTEELADLFRPPDQAESEEE